MEITILDEEENPMLHRRDVRFRVSHVESSPDRLAVRDSLAARMNKSAEEVVIRRLDTKFGMRETIGEAKVYEGAAEAQEVEHEHMLARNKIGDAAEEVTEDGAPEDETGAEAEEEVEEVEETEEAEAEAEAEPEEVEEEADAEAGEAE